MTKKTRKSRVSRRTRGRMTRPEFEDAVLHALVMKGARDPHKTFKESAPRIHTSYATAEHPEDTASDLVFYETGRRR